MNMEQTQLELFANYETPKQPEPTSTITVEIDGVQKQLTDQDIDNLEKICGRCENEDGVGLFELIRWLKRDGARCVKLM